MQPSTKIPSQTIPASKKTKDWHQRTMDAYIDLANLNPANRNRRRQLYEYYEAYNGIVNDDYYTHVLKPYGKERENFPAKLHRYNIIQPLVNQLVGEKVKRPFDYSVIVSNPDVHNRKIEERQSMLRSMLRQIYAEELAAAQQQQSREGGGGGGEQSIAHIMEKFESEYNDERAITGQQCLDYIYYNNEMYHHLRKGWKDFLIAGEVYSFRGARHGEPVYEILNPLDIDFDMDPDLEFVEDGDWALVRQYVHISSVIDIYHDELTKDEIALIEEGQRHPNSDFYWDSRRYQDRDIQRDRTVEVIRLYWKSRKKIGFSRWIEDGELYEKQVEEGYEPDPELNEEVEWMWVNEVRQGHRINGDIYKRMRPVDTQRSSLDNPSKCKLPINGRLASNRNAANVSLLAMLLPYQIAYDIYKYRMEVSIAKSKDLLAHLDLDMIPDDWDMDKFLYYMDATGIVWTESAKEGRRPDPTHQSVIDLTVRTIESYLALLESIVQEMERSVGITRQRQGQLHPYEGKGVTEQSILQSSHITEDMFLKYAWFEQRELQAMLDYSRPAWILGKKASYFLPDEGMQILNIDGIEHASSEYAVFVADAREQAEKVQAARQLAQPMIQNGVNPSTILEIFESKHFATIRKKVKKAEQVQARLEAARDEARQASEAAEREMKMVELQSEAEQNELDRANNLDVERIRTEGRIADNQTRKEIERIKEDNKKNIEEAKRRLEERKLQIEKALKREEIAIKRRSQTQSS